MKMLNVLALLLLISSCATSKSTNTEEIKKDVKEGNVSMGAILDLARSSYLKGCVDGIKHLVKEKTHGQTFEFCKLKAKLHEDDIFDILKQ